jgi:hypothetical protein
MVTVIAVSASKYSMVGQAEHARILSARDPVPFVELMDLLDLVSMPHWPEERSGGKDLDFGGVAASNDLVICGNPFGRLGTIALRTANGLSTLTHGSSTLCCAHSSSLNVS